MATIETIAPTVITEHRGDHDIRRRQIVAAANSLLSEEGLEGLTVRALLKRTGLARRAFYDGFPGKDDLVLAVFESVLRDAADHFHQHFANEPDPLKCVRYFIENIVMGAYLQGDPSIAERRSVALSREHLRLAEARPKELEGALRPLLDCLAEQVERGMRSGQMRPADPELQARLIYNLLAAMTHTELLGEGGMMIVERRRLLAKAIWEFCRGAIVA